MLRFNCNIIHRKNIYFKIHIYKHKKKKESKISRKDILENEFLIIL
jgi:hypothetical protein